jgi:hypothetical protein
MFLHETKNLEKTYETLRANWGRFSKPPKKEQEYETYVNAFYDLYFVMALVEEWRQGNLPAWEGIRLVRERVELD